MIRVVHPGSGFFIHPGSRVPDPGVKKAPDPDPQHWSFSILCLGIPTSKFFEVCLNLESL
jgi:hypothetical protein